MSELSEQFRVALPLPLPSITPPPSPPRLSPTAAAASSSSSSSFSSFSSSSGATSYRVNCANSTAANLLTYLNTDCTGDPAASTPYPIDYGCDVQSDGSATSYTCEAETDFVAPSPAANQYFFNGVDACPPGAHADLSIVLSYPCGQCIQVCCRSFLLPSYPPPPAPPNASRANSSVGSYLALLRLPQYPGGMGLIYTCDDSATTMNYYTDTECSGDPYYSYPFQDMVRTLSTGDWKKSARRCPY